MRSAGKRNSPLALLTTVVVTVEPSFLALTRTPSISPSSAEDTLPLRVCAFAPIVVRPASSPAKLTVTKSLLDVISALPPRIIRIGSANINSAKLLAATSSAIGRRMVRREHRGVTNLAGRITAYNKLLLQFGRSGRSRIVGCCTPHPYPRSRNRNFLQRPPITMRGMVLPHVGQKEKCAAKPEEHRGNALFALSAPFYLQSFSRNVTATQKVQRMTRS